MTDSALIEHITRSLAFMLRHQPERFDLDVDAYGYAPLDDVVRALNERIGEPVTREDVVTAVGAGDRVRYEIQGDTIRALYGHSIAVEPGPASKPPETLFVAIPESELERAQRFGLRGGRRRFLHLAKTLDDARESGRRAAREYAVLSIAALEAWEEGVNFYDRFSLWLAEEVPTHLLEVEGVYEDGTEPMTRGRGREPRRGDGGGGRSRGGRGRSDDRRSARSRDGEDRGPRRRGGRDRDRNRDGDRDRDRDRGREGDRERVGRPREDSAPRREPARGPDGGGRRPDGGDRDRGERRDRGQGGRRAEQETIVPASPAPSRPEREPATARHEAPGSAFGAGLDASSKKAEERRPPAPERPARRREEPREERPREERRDAGPQEGSGGDPASSFGAGL